MNAKGLVTGISTNTLALAHSLSDVVVTTPSNGQVLSYNFTNSEWVNTTPTIAVTGDATGSGTNSIALTLDTVNANAGTFGSATQESVFTVNAKGLITAASSVTITPAFSSLTGSLAAAQLPAFTGDVTSSCWK